MANTIKVKRSATPSAVPTTGQLDLGEIAVNTYDGKLYIKKDNGTASIVEVGASGGGGLTSLNSQTGATQSFAVGTSGSNFAVSSASNVHTFNLPDASATNRGALTSANWTTFNNKLGSLNSQTGATQTFAVGTAGTDFAVSSSADTHTFNLPSASASARGVVTTAAQTFAGAKTFSSDITVNGVKLGRGNNSATSSNTCVGNNVLTNVSSGTSNTAVGLNSMQNLSTGNWNTAAGVNSMYFSNVASACSYFGVEAGYNTSGGNNTGVGFQALYAVQGASGNTAIGSQAGRYITGTGNTFVGTNCDATSAGNFYDYCLGIGYAAICTGANSIAIGRSASAAANCFDLRFGNAQRMVGDANGQFGINEASPGAQLQITSGSASRKGLIVKAAASATANIVEVQNSSGTALISVDSTGRVFFNTTTVRNGGQASLDFNGSAAAGYAVNDTSSSHGSPLVSFLTGGTIRCSITNNNNTGVSYNTTSDYRLKTNVLPMTGGLQKALALKPKTWTWTQNNTPGEGFVAHELADVIPCAVTGDKDAVDADGNPKYQGVDTSFVVATLTAAIQELNAKVEALEARLLALETTR